MIRSCYFAAAISWIAFGACENAFAAEQALIEVQDRGGYSRLIIVTPDKIDFFAEITDSELRIDFGRILQGDFSAPVVSAPEFFLASRHGDETSALHFSVASGARLHTSQSMNVIAIDILSPEYLETPKNIVSHREILRDKLAGFFGGHTPSLKSHALSTRGEEDASAPAAPVNLSMLQLDMQPVAPVKSVNVGVADYNPVVEFQTYRAKALKDGFESTEGSLLSALAEANDETRKEAAIQLAYFYMAHALYAEALSVLVELPGEAQAADASLLAGIANYQIGRYDDAAALLGIDALQGNENAAPWRGMANAKRGAYKAAAPDLFAVASSAIPFEDNAADYFLTKTAVAIRAEEFALAQTSLKDLRKTVLDNNARAERSLLEAQWQIAQGRRDSARQLLQRIIAAGLAPYSQRAKLEVIMGGVDEGVLDADAALDRLDALTLSWSGGAFEREALVAHAELCDRAGRVADAFHSRRRLIDAFPSADDSAEAQRKMAAALAALFEGPQLSPLAASQIFYENIDLAPPGRDGDRLIRNIADELAALDLLDEAAELLEHQVFKRLRGPARSAAAADLASLYLSNAKPQEALRVLKTTRLARLPEGLNDRRRWLEARALWRKNIPERAIALLDGDESSEAFELRGEIHWAAKQWSEAGAAFAAAVDTQPSSGERAGAPMNRHMTAIILKAASAYALASDAAALQALALRVEAQITDDAARTLLHELAFNRVGENADSFHTAYNAYFSIADTRK